MGRLHGTVGKDGTYNIDTHPKAPLRLEMRHLLRLLDLTLNLHRVVYVDSSIVRRSSQEATLRIHR